MKKYFLGLFSLLIIASLLFVGVNKVSALTSVNSVTATIVDTPTLKLSYDNSSSRLRNESLLTANFKVRVKAGNVDSKIYLNFANVELVNKTGVSNQNTNTKTISIISSLGLYKENTDQYGRRYVIVPANSEVDFKVETTRKPSELFAGSYTASLLNLVNYDDSFEYGVQQIKVSENKTNSVTIVGEKSPYIESATSTQIKCLDCDSTVTIKGVRMYNAKLATSSYLYGKVSSWIIGSDGKTIKFKTKIIGSYDIKIFDSKTGLSNNVNIKIDSTVFEPSVTITSPSKRTTVGNTFEASGSCTNYQGNVSVYYYSTRKVSVDAKCLNGKWSTDINLETNALSGTFTLYASLSTGQQATLEVPFKIKYIVSTQPSISPTETTINSGDSVKFKFTYPQNTTKASLSIICPTGVTSGTSPEVCNSGYMNITSNIDWTMILLNSTSETKYVDVVYSVSFSDPTSYKSQNVTLKAKVAVKPSTVVTPSITVLSPNGGEVWRAGTTQTIKWQAENFNGSVVYVELRPRMSGSSKIALGSPIHGEMSWQIPKDLAPGLYKIELYKASDRGVIDPNEEVKDVSDNYFTITKSTPSIEGTVTITGTPTLELTYDYLARKESQLTAKFNISVEAGNYDLDIYQRANPISFISTNGKSMNGDVSLSNVTNLKSSTDKYGQVYFIVPAGTTASFTATSQVNSKIMFAGSYSATFQSLIAFVDGNASNNAIAIAPLNNKSTNSKTIIGETSPYIISVTQSLKVGELMLIKGSRINSDSVYIDGNAISMGSSKGDGSTNIGFILPNISVGPHYIQVSNVNGMSNKVYFEVTGSVINQPSITILSPNGGETFTKGQNIPISFSSKNLTDKLNPNGVTIQLYRAQKVSPGYISDIVKNYVGGSPYNWTVPNSLGSDLYYIYIAAPVVGISLPEAGVSDFSDDYFTISSETQNCTYTYGDWGTCIDGFQKRDYSSSPVGCTGTPIYSQSCIVIPPVVDDDSYCGSKTQSPLPAGCGSKKAQVSQAGVVLSDTDVIEVIKIANFYRSSAKWGASIVTCPANTNYRVCVENGNDGAANYILLGVKSAKLNYNSSRTTATALESMKIEDFIQLLQLLK